MRPSLRNLFMKKLTRDRVVPIISARVSWLIFGMIGWGLSSLPKLANSSHKRASRFSLDKELIDQVFRDPAIAGQQIRHEHFGKLRLIMKHREHGCLRYCGDQT